jgi:hypothetical protein
MSLGILGIDHRHIYGQLAGMQAVGYACAGWWTEGDPGDVGQGFRKRFPDIPQVDKARLLEDEAIDLILIAAVQQASASASDMVTRPARNASPQSATASPATHAASRPPGASGSSSRLSRKVQAAATATEAMLTAWPAALPPPNSGSASATSSG